MRWLFAAAFVAAAWLSAPVHAQTAAPQPDPQTALDAIIFGTPAPVQAPVVDESADGTILGMSYKEAALVGGGVVLTAVVINALAGGNLGTFLGALYVGHLLVEAALVAGGGASMSWGFGWWDDSPPAPAE